MVGMKPAVLPGFIENDWIVENGGGSTPGRRYNNRHGRLQQLCYMTEIQVWYNDTITCDKCTNGQGKIVGNLCDALVAALFFIVLRCRAHLPEQGFFFAVFKTKQPGFSIPG